MSEDSHIMDAQSEKASIDDRYQMTVDLNVLDHLGINLYSNIAAVLTEAVANAWDADAEKVEITINKDDDQIEIFDDGVGMTIKDINEKYLRVGYRRRVEDTEHGKLTAKGRPIMGRKGLGKLSLFSIAKLIAVQSAKEGQIHGFRMSLKGIKKSAEEKKQYYQPEPLPSEEITVTKGTKIVLQDTKRQRLDLSEAALRKRLARRFSVIGELHGFMITVNGQSITAEDRGDLRIAQFLWAFGNFRDQASTSSFCEQEHLPHRLDDWPNDWEVNGWIGTSRLPKQLDDKDAGNLNSIVVFARGRLFHENILEKVNDGRLYTKYLTGQIEADFLDQDNKPDIATSDRQRVQEDDERYDALLRFLKSRLSDVEKRWTEWRRKHEVEKAKETFPALAKWLESLKERLRGNAEELIAKLSALPVDDEEDRKDLYRHGILAFERMRIRDSTKEFTAGVENVDRLLTMLGDSDALEAALYCDIVRSRLAAIREFSKIVEDASKEKVLQQYLFDHLWLLDPAWERATGSERIESRLLEKGSVPKELTKGEELARVDIAYRTNAGKHLIVELKKADRKLELNDLLRQGQTYVDKLSKILRGQGEKSPNIEVIFVLGKPVKEEEENPNRLKATMAAVSEGSRIVYYDALIQGAQNAYSEYLEKSKELDRIEEIVDQI